MPKNYSHESRVNRARMRMSCACESAKEIFVASTFSGWNPRALPMRRYCRKEWTAEVELVPGVYEYKFVIDGEWSCEPGSDDRNVSGENCAPNGFGTMNRKLEVS